jgi:hypothetical protein
VAKGDWVSTAQADAFTLSSCCQTSQAPTPLPAAAAGRPRAWHQLCAVKAEPGSPGSSACSQPKFTRSPEPQSLGRALCPDQRPWWVWVGACQAAPASFRLSGCLFPAYPLSSCPTPFPEDVAGWGARLGAAFGSSGHPVLGTKAHGHRQLTEPPMFMAEGKDKAPRR